MSCKTLYVAHRVVDAFTLAVYDNRSTAVVAGFGDIGITQDIVGGPSSTTTTTKPFVISDNELQIQRGLQIGWVGRESLQWHSYHISQE